MSNYGEILQELQRSIDDLKGRGITVESLDHSLEELRRHSENIEKVEASIEAVQEEVLSPIKEELRENKQAARFSRWGAFLGAAGLIATILALYTTSDVALDERLAAIERHFDVPATSESDAPVGTIKISYYGETEILGAGGRSVTVDMYQPDGALGQNDLVGGLDFKLDGREIGYEKLPDIVQVVRRRDENFYKNVSVYSSVRIAEGDSFVLFDESEFVIEKILSTEPNGRDFGDDETAILLRRLGAISEGTSAAIRAQKTKAAERDAEPDAEQPQN